ncbi:MAG: tripartite tricarboxylate transporter substrate binding protein [Burkholderiales bacterium]|nr:tripartite tricarboxylate transporter substrate binding protein [Burkholderiales bacterium]MDP2399394.1 tripartite tricarboxylate transporter substrate binding protein [Burkholderiales bacterium]
MRMTRILAAACLFATSTAFAADAYPVRPVRVIVPFAPGGATDIVARLVAQKLTETWGQTMVVDNRAGAGGNIGGELAARANPDGYTLFMTSGSIVTANQHMYAKMAFSPEKDLVAVTNVASGPQVIAVNAGNPAKTLKEFIEMAKAKPKSMTFGSAGVGTQTHLAAENFVYASGIDVTHVPYKGEGPAVTDLVGGQIQFVTPNLSAAIAFVNSGKLRALAVTSKERAPQLPNVPAVAETLPGFENLGWFGFMVPTGTPKFVIDKVHADTVKALRSPDLIKRFNDIGMVPVGNSPQDFARDIKAESARWEKIIKERNLQVK